MCVRKDVYTRLTVRFPEEKMVNAALFDFCFKFNAMGFLAHGLPLAASFSRLHAAGHTLWEYDSALTASYLRRVTYFAKKIAGQKMSFISASGKIVSEQVIFL